MRGSLVVLAVLGFVFAGCGRSSAPERLPLEPPSPQKETLTVRSRMYRGSGAPAPEGHVALEPSYDIVLELHPSGRWRYAWRDCDDVNGAWHELHGMWAPGLGRAWVLVPDDPGKALDPGKAAPSLSWGPTVGMPEGESPEAAIRSGKVKQGAYCYFMPVVDRETGRFGENVTIVPDPREAR